MEMQKDFKVYVELYEELVEKYKELSEEYEIFDMMYLDIESNAWIPGFIKVNKKERCFERGFMDFAIEELCKMESELIKIIDYEKDLEEFEKY